MPRRGRRRSLTDLGVGTSTGADSTGADSTDADSTGADSTGADSTGTGLPPTAPLTPGASPAVKTSLSAPSFPSSAPIVVGRPTPAFEPKVSDVAYRQIPYRPDTSLDGWSTKSFTMRAASSRGHLHRYNGTPRQDDFAVAVGPRPNQLLVAIADGVSAAPQSHIGSTTAVRYSIQWLTSSVAESTAETDWKGLVENVAWALIEQAAAVLGSEDTSAETAERILATTLVCAVLDADGQGGAEVHVVGVGDSGAWVVRQGSFERLEGGKEESESGLSSSAVSGLPRVPTEVVARFGRVGPGEILLLGTDGFGDPLGRGDGEVGALFRSVLEGRVPSLIEFAHAVDFSRETFDDDRTLVAVWPVAPLTDDS